MGQGKMGGAKTTWQNGLRQMQVNERDGSKKANLC